MLTALKTIGAANVGGFLVTVAMKREYIVDLMGTGSIGISAYLLGSGGDERTRIASGAIVAWSLRLSTFLAYRAFVHGDDRLKKFLPRPGNAWTMRVLKRMATFWVLQAVWGFVMLLPQVTLPSSASASVGQAGLSVAGVAWLLEAIADYHKLLFKSRNPNQTLTSGLYSIVQYPNYTMEILFWLGLGYYYIQGVPSSSSLSILKWLIGFCPAAFVTLLLLKASGIPLTQKARLKRVANDPALKAYAEKTPLLIPFIY